jgi:hypothetical protein
MKTVSSIENYIKTKPFFIECFIFRHYQFDVTSRNIMSELESEFKRSEEGAVVMALKD